MSGLLQPIHESQPEPLALHCLAEDRFYPGSIAFTKELEDPSGILIDGLAKGNLGEVLRIVGWIDPDVGRPVTAEDGGWRMAENDPGVG